jgi:hypothetical protein
LQQMVHNVNGICQNFKSIAEKQGEGVDIDDFEIHIQKNGRMDLVPGGNINRRRYNAPTAAGGEMAGILPGEGDESDGGPVNPRQIIAFRRTVCSLMHPLGPNNYPLPNFTNPSVKMKHVIADNLLMESCIAGRRLCGDQRAAPYVRSSPFRASLPSWRAGVVP